MGVRSLVSEVGGRGERCFLVCHEILVMMCLPDKWLVMTRGEVLFCKVLHRHHFIVFRLNGEVDVQ